MNFRPSFCRCFLPLLAIWLACFAAEVRAESKATATLSQTTMAPGDSISMTVELTDVNEIRRPESIPVEGLEIRYAGFQQSTQITNGAVTRSVTLTYIISASAAGAYIIPPLEFSTNAGTLKTEPLHLRVEVPAPGSRPAPTDDQPVTYAEIKVPRKTVYVGEAVPVEVQLVVDKRIRWRIDEMPVLEGEGFTKVKFPRPSDSTMRRDGRDYDVLTFRTTISPSKAGKVTLGPMDVSFVASIPRAKRARPRSPLDLFDDGFFDDPFGRFGQMERRKITADPVELEVKPLPVAGRPAEFSGAVGKFQMTVEGSPKQVKIGDPVTLKMSIAGAGNFDRVNAPELVDKSGWHTYEPSNSFTPTNDMQTNGTKVFEMAVIPEEKKTQLPQVRFSFFDPEEAKYVTLESDPIPLTVEGTPPPKTAAPTPVTTPAAEATPPPPAPEKEIAKDIVGLKYERGALSQTFEPMYRSRAFLFLQAVPLVALLGLLGARFFRKDEAASRAASLRRERDELLRRVRAERSEAEFYETAARLVQVETALATGRLPASVDAPVATASRRLDAEVAAGVDEIFAKRAELLYAGSVRSDGRVSEADRDRALTALERFQEAHARG